MANTNSVNEFNASLHPFPTLSQLPLSTHTTFIDLSLRHWNQLIQRTGAPLEQFPGILLPIYSQMLTIPPAIILMLWQALSKYIANLYIANLATQTPDVTLQVDNLIWMYSVDGKGGDVLGPPISNCTNETCPRHGKPLTDQVDHPARLFTLHRKVIPVISRSLYCRGCLTRYYPNYFVRDASFRDSDRVYYPDIPVPKYLHVQEATFVDLELCDWFRSMFLQQNASIAIAKVYNSSMAKINFHLNMPLHYHMDKDVVYDAFFLHALLLDKQARSQTLVLPHRAPNNRERLAPALQERNQAMEGIGQEQWAHACNLCCKVHRREDGRSYSLTAVVTDGVTLGHKCCRVLDCHEPLERQLDLFCPDHHHLSTRCCVDHCSSEALLDSRACGLPEHQELVKIAENRKYTKRKRENDKRAARAGEIHDDDHPADPEAEPESPKKRARLAPRWTHNEQLVVHPCGIIISRATFNGSEAVSATATLLKTTFPPDHPGSLPSFCVYDHNCGMVKHLRAQGDHYFDDCGLPIDVFHFKKGSHVHDDFCQANCSPHLFPELKDENGNWLFNTSIAEQINAWFGGFQSITREMRPDRYNFFLDEMISLHNRDKVEQLRQKAHNPHIVPQEHLRAPCTF